MILSDFHTHTNYCDGKNTPREMVEAAIKMNMKNIGFSVHSYTFFDESYCIKEQKISEYKNEIFKLKNEYADKIKIFCGVEKDYYSDMDTSGFDYVIGSVHYIKHKGKYFPIDYSEEMFLNVVNECFEGDFMLLAREYYKSVSEVCEKTKCDIIGHLDLISKYNEGERLFAETAEYKMLVQNAIDRLLKSNAVFELNTGAISRGIKSTPYPSEFALSYILKNGGKVVLSGDAHTTDTLCFEFDKWENKICDLGFCVSDFQIKE